MTTRNKCVLKPMWPHLILTTEIRRYQSDLTWSPSVIRLVVPKVAQAISKANIKLANWGPFVSFSRYREVIKGTAKATSLTLTMKYTSSLAFLILPQMMNLGNIQRYFTFPRVQWINWHKRRQFFCNQGNVPTLGDTCQDVSGQHSKSYLYISLNSSCLIAYISVLRRWYLIMLKWYRIVMYVKSMQATKW